ncbi:MAG: matrixin family metalloprotease [Phycisphaerae bacterium]|nr:matrixin family metalloprotease [Phycisphaerae bacterium]
MRNLSVVALGCILALAGCNVAEGLLGLSGFLGSASDTLGKAGTCLSPLGFVDLDEVFDEAVPVEWNDDSADLTDEPQAGVAAFYAEQLGDVVLPLWYLNERFHQLGPLSAGQVLVVECLSDVVESAWLYDAEFTQLGAWSTHDEDGNLRTVEIPIAYDMTDCLLRINLWYLSETHRPIVRLTRRAGDATVARALQTVVLDFAGANDLTYRSGGLLPTDVAPLEDAAVREIVVRAFREAFALCRLEVLTDQDPPPTGPASRIFIGVADPPLGVDYAGLAEWVDGRNLVPDDIAVVDVGAQAFQLARLLGTEVYGTSIGKVAAHEMGHLLGLWHVVDADALMSGAGCQGLGVDVERALRREFKRAPVQAFTEPSPDATLGEQDAPAYLMEILGPADAAE